MHAWGESEQENSIEEKEEEVTNAEQSTKGKILVTEGGSVNWQLEEHS